MSNYLFICFLLFSWVNFNTAQDSLTFSPSTPLCIGEEVQMTCFVVPPTAQQFIDSSALLSFNGSAALSPALVTSTGIIDGTDISRYTASSDGLTISNERPGVRLSISDYQATDGYVVFGCHGLYSGIVASPVIISSRTQRLAVAPLVPVLVISQTDPNCSNTLISWSTPSSDRSITSYSVYRDGVSIYNGPNTTNQFTDNTQLNINTVYEYSVVAISCAGTSTAGINSIRLGTSLVTSSLIISYNDTTNELFVDWTLNQPTQLITVTYNLSLEYNYTQFNVTNSYDETEIFSQISTDTDYTQSLTVPTFLSNGLVESDITATLSITRQCNTLFSDGIVLTATTESTSTTLATTPPVTILPIIIGCVAAVGVILCLITLIFVIVVLACCIRNRKNTADTSAKKSHLYEEVNETRTGEYVDMNRMNITAVKQPTESQHYTHMSPLDKKQLPPNYENMNKF